MRFILAFLFTLSLKSNSEEISIFEVKRNIPLSDSDPIFRDFYLKNDDSKSLKKNLVVQVTRKITLRDSAGSQVIGEIMAPVGQLKIIAVYGRIAVAREFPLFWKRKLAHARNALVYDWRYD
jgi:hypothetical protein